MGLLEIFDPAAAPRPVGIDLGTTNSVVAPMRDGIPVAIRDCDGETLVPSAVFYDDKGQTIVGREALRMAGLTTDVTDQKLSELALAESEERYRSVLAGLAEGVMLIAPDGGCLAANDSAERILGLARDELMGRKLRDPAWQTVYADGTPFPASDYPAIRTLETGEPCSDVLMGVRRETEDLRWITINTKPLFRSGDSTATP